MRKIFVLVAALAAALLMTAQAAFADSLHFIKVSSGVTADGQLSASFKVAGLGTNDSSVTATVSAQATVVYQCWNNGGNHPKAGNKETVNGPVSGSGTFARDKNGTVSGTLLSGAIPGPGAFSCPNGQTLYLESVAYTGGTLTVTTNTGSSVSTQIPDATITLHVPA